MIAVSNTLGQNPPRMILHGGEKVGKSTFASQCPGSIFIPTEEGLRGINARAIKPKDKSRCETFEEFTGALNYAEQNPDIFSALIIDSADWLEELIHRKICADYKKSNLAECAGGYGKGYLVAMNYWHDLLMQLDRINKLGKWVIFICHSKAVTFNNPLGEPYDLWTMKLHSDKKQKGSLDMMAEWADIIAFAYAETFVNETQTTASKEKGDKLHRAVVTGRRILHLEPTQAFLAGNRYGIKQSCGLTWDEFMAKFAETQQTQ